ALLLPPGRRCESLARGEERHFVADGLGRGVLLQPAQGGAGAARRRLVAATDGGTGHAWPGGLRRDRRLFGDGRRRRLPRPRETEAALAPLCGLREGRRGSRFRLLQGGRQDGTGREAPRPRPRLWVVGLPGVKAFRLARPGVLRRRRHA